MLRYIMVIASFKFDINSTHNGMFKSLDNDKPNYLTSEIHQLMINVIFMLAKVHIILKLLLRIIIV